MSKHYKKNSSRALIKISLPAKIIDWSVNSIDRSIIRQMPNKLLVLFSGLLRF